MFLWIGFLIGSYLGHRAMGPLGALIGGLAGSYIELKVRRARHSRSRARSSVATDLDCAYATLGVSPRVSDDEVHRAYHRKAKKYHPDVLRARGFSEDKIAKATELMSRLNAAWALIKSTRDL